MGYQLWTSPITGYRRRGTRLVELHAVLGSQITARAIFEPLQSCPADAPAREMSRALEQRDFDVAGVRIERDGPVIGFVERKRLKNKTIRDHLAPLTEDDWVKESLSLASLIQRLKQREFVFVRLEANAAGIITQADLNKPPVRVYLFGLISLLEMHLSYWVKAEFPENAWPKAIKPKRLKKAEEHQGECRRRKHDLELVDCLQFCDKRDLLVGKESVRSDLCLGSKGEATTRLHQAEDLRNRLAHSHYDLIGGTSWGDLFCLVEWMEAVIQASDGCVEQRAQQGAQVDFTGLW
jgi:hypothetical protein